MVGKVADMVANMVADMLANMLADMVAKMVVDMEVDKVANQHGYCICVSTGYTLWCCGFGLN